MALSSEKNQDAINLRFRLVSLTLCGMVEERLGNGTLLIKLPKQVDIRRFLIHSWFSSQTPMLTGMWLSA
jgi:hypothetical protein